MSDISLLLQCGWKNIWKEKLLWLFGALILVEPLISLFPVQKSTSLLSSILTLAEIVAYFSLLLISNMGTTYIAYCIAAGNPVNIQTAFQAVRKFFWRIVVSTFFLFLFFVPCLCSVIVFSYKKPPQISDFSHNIFLSTIPLSVFSALMYFLIAEIMVSDSGIRKSIKIAWSVFTNHFPVLAITGIILWVVWYVMSITIGITTILILNNVDFAALNKLDYITPSLSFKDNSFFQLANTMASMVWRTYSTAVFTMAYLKFSGIKIKTPYALK